MSSFIGRQGLEISIPGSLLQNRLEQGLVLSLLPRQPQPWEESSPVRIGKVKRKTFQDHHFCMKWAPLHA